MQPDLDLFRDAVASVHLDGSHVGYLATKVEAMRSGLLLRRGERVWLLLTRLDGTLDIQEDYPPWTYVLELRDGHVNWSWTQGGPDADYEVRWLSGSEREEAWTQYGIVRDVGVYMRRRDRELGPLPTRKPLCVKPALASAP